MLILHVQLLFQSSTMDLVLYFHCLNGVNLLCHASADICFERDTMRISKSKYKTSDHGKAIRRRARKRHKGFEDNEKEREGPMYVPGGFDDQPGPSTASKKQARSS